MDTGKPDCGVPSDIRAWGIDVRAYGDHAGVTDNLGPKSDAQLAEYTGLRLAQLDYDNSSCVCELENGHAFAVSTNQGNFAIAHVEDVLEETETLTLSFVTYASPSG